MCVCVWCSRSQELSSSPSPQYQRNSTAQLSDATSLPRSRSSDEQQQQQRVTSSPAAAAASGDGVDQRLKRDDGKQSAFIYNNLLTTADMYRVAPKWRNFLYAFTLWDINQFTKSFDCQNLKKICNNAITKNLTTHQVLSLIHIWRCRRSYACRSRWSPYH